MSSDDDISKVKSLVKRILEENHLETFAEYWDLCRELVEGLPVRAFYVYIDGSYANLAILTDKMIVDIVADEDDETLDDLAVIAMKSIAEVHFRTGAMETLPDSEEAQLVLVLSMVGATDTGPYWVAETDAEREHLTRFGKALMNAVNAL